MNLPILTAISEHDPSHEAAPKHIMYISIKMLSVSKTFDELDLCRYLYYTRSAKLFSGTDYTLYNTIW